MANSSVYNHINIEKKWQARWAKEKTFRFDAKNPSVRRSRTSPLTRGDSFFKKKYYALDMFPYPSGAGLHVGHPLSYTATDIHSRYRRMKGYEVLHPMGFDALGLPAENHAIKVGIHPETSTLANIKTFTRQLKGLGFSYDWDRQVATCLPDYYRWTQWWFSFFYRQGLAYKKKSPVNWCKSCQTVLANEQVVDGQCERCDTVVRQKDLEQWFFRITDFVEDGRTEERMNGRTNVRKTSGLLSGLDAIDWPESTKMGQRNWIGKKLWIDISYPIKGTDETIIVSTTRPDTNFGATFVVLAPEHEFFSDLSRIPDRHRDGVKEYIRKTKLRTELERISDGKVKTGAFTGLFCLNQITGYEMPMYVTDFVLATVGTGAVVGVPGHDMRDFEFAQAFDLEIKRVVVGKDGDRSAITRPEQVQEVEGVMINSGFLDGMDIKDAIGAMMDHIEKNGWGKKTVRYLLRDWLVSRQRYWGAPIPIVYDNKGDHYLLPDSELPVRLPKDVDFVPKGKSPLALSKAFHAEKDLLRIEKKLKKSGEMPKDRTIVRRENDTMDTFVCSSWYFWRFMDNKNKKVFCDKKLANALGPVDLYVGGAEHTVLHLLYARFFCKALHRSGYIDYDEPFVKLRHQGMILGENHEKMSKSKGNVVNPDDIMKEFGADTLRVYEMFMGPFEQMKPWSSRSVAGVRRFLDKVWRLSEKVHSKKKFLGSEKKIAHKTIKKVTEDIENFRFNTAVSAMMILVNELSSAEVVSGEAYKTLLMLLSPMAPHVTEELWERVKSKDKKAKSKDKKADMIGAMRWPAFDARLAMDDEVEMPVQVNGKLRATMRVSVDISKESALNMARALENVRGYLEGKKVVKEIFVPGKIVNLVVG